MRRRSKSDARVKKPNKFKTQMLFEALTCSGRRQRSGNRAGRFRTKFPRCGETSEKAWRRVPTGFRRASTDLAQRPRAACQDGRADRAWPARLQQTGNRGICTIYSSPLALKPLLSGLSHPRHGDVRPRAAALAAKPLNKMQTGFSEAARAAVVTGLSLREAERAIAAPAAAQREVQDLCQLRLAGRWHRAVPENESAAAQPS